MLPTAPQCMAGVNIGGCYNTAIVNRQKRTVIAGICNLLNSEGDFCASDFIPVYRGIRERDDRDGLRESC